MIKKNINKILSFSFMFSLLGISSYAKDVKTDNTPPVISYTEEQIGDREALRVTVTATDESGIREFRDHNGNVIVGNTTTVEFNRRGDSTFTAIDNAGNESSITIDLSWVNPYNSGTPGRIVEGGTYWTSSNIREWLNSDNLNVNYTSTHPSYKDEAGFLNSFSESEKNAIALTERRTWINGEYDSESKEGGTINSGHLNHAVTFLSTFYDLAFNYKNYSYRKNVDKVFLLNPYECYWYLNRRNFPYDVSLTEQAKLKHNTEKDSYSWFITGGTQFGGHDRGYIANPSNVPSHQSYPYEKHGIRPALNLKPTYILKDGRRVSDLKIGDVVKFGEFMDNSIEWIVINISDSGFPMLLANNVLDLKEYDAPGDQSRIYSDYINYDNYDVSLFSDVQYKSLSGKSNTDIPTLEILNKEELDVRKNEAFSLQFNVITDSLLDYLELPNGNKIYDNNFSYDFATNGRYIFKIMDTDGNYNEFLVPVSNINEEPFVNLTLSSNGWSSKDVSVDIDTSNNFKVLKNHLKLGTESGIYSSSIFPNFSSYSGRKFIISGEIELKYCNQQSIGKNIGIAPNFTYKIRSEKPYTYVINETWLAVGTLCVDDLLDAGVVPFQFEYTIPDNYSSDLQAQILMMGKGFGDVVEFEIYNLKFESLEASDFNIVSIELPNGDILNCDSYVDVITKEGVHNLTYKVLDSRGLTTEKTVAVKVDKTKPILNLNYNYDKFDFLSNKSLVVNVSGSDALSGFKRIKFPDGTYTSSSNTTYTIRDYGTYVFECEDVAGNVTRETIVVEDMSVFEDAERLVEVAEQTRNSQDISNARDAVNNLPESSKKDELQDRLNAITNISDITFDKKSATSNIDVYIKSENMLLMSLSTNSITFNDFSGVEDMELNNAINISINSSLPYQLNSYLLSEIENSGKSNRIEKDLLNIKVNKDSDYKNFNAINKKLVLEDDCDAGNNKSHSIDLKLKGSQAHEADIYKTVIKFEAEQK